MNTTKHKVSAQRGKRGGRTRELGDVTLTTVKAEVEAWNAKTFPKKSKKRIAQEVEVAVHLEYLRVHAPKRFAKMMRLLARLSAKAAKRKAA